MDISWLKQDRTDVKLFVTIQPSAKKTLLDSIHNDRLKIKISSPPLDGKANEELIKYLSKILDMKKKDILISSGQTSKLKTVVLKNQNFQDIYTVIDSLIK